MNQGSKNAAYDWYWENYKNGMEWLKKHETAYWKSHALALKAENAQMLQIIHDMQYSSNSTPFHHTDVSVRRRSKRSKKKRKNTFGNKATQSDLDVEVSPELIEFFKTSLKHKKALQKETEMRESSLSAFTPPQEIQDLRQKEMKELYGEGYSKILGMETAMTLAFERYIDQKAPEHWPANPFT